MAQPNCIDFARWSKRNFNCWLAGFFDGEGCVHMPPIGIDVSIANTNRGIMEAIRRRIGFGTLQVIDPGRPRWKIKYHLRFRRQAEAAKVLRMMLPHLTIKRTKALVGLERTDGLAARRCAIVARNREILRLRRKGLFHWQIADRVGIHRSNVTMILAAAGR